LLFCFFTFQQRRIQGYILPTLSKALKSTLKISGVSVFIFLAIP